MASTSIVQWWVAINSETTVYNCTIINSILINICIFNNLRFYDIFQCYLVCCLNIFIIQYNSRAKIVVMLLVMSYKTAMCYFRWLLCFFYVEVWIQSSSNIKIWLDRSTRQTVKPEANNISHPREWDSTGKEVKASETGDRGLEPSFLGQPEHYLY